jgi:SecD/SecF fusion protein
MSERRRHLLVLLIVLGLIAGSAVAIITQTTKLGLDLQGGVQLVYQGKPTKQTKVTAESLQRALDIMRDRVDAFGVAEPELARTGKDQIEVNLPGVDDAERAANQVGSTAQLFFYDWEKNVLDESCQTNDTEINGGQQPVSGLYNAVKRASKCEIKLPKTSQAAAGPRFYAFDKVSKKPFNNGLPDETRAGALEGLSGAEREKAEVLEVKPGVLVLRDEKPSADAPDPDTYWIIRDDPGLSGTDIKNPEQNFDQRAGNEPNVTFDFSDKGREAFQRITATVAQRGADNANPLNPDPEQNSQHFAIALDNELVSIPLINYRENPDGIDGSTGAQISGGFTITSAQDLAKVLKTGALPLRLELISRSQVSATLGKQALNQGLKAGIAGFIVVALFLLLFYRVLGLIATAALAIYGLYFFAIIKLIPVTLTLPGIAGLILTLGVAADANIVIFERVKEEVRAGRSVAAGLAAGYKKGFSTIVDANIVTLLVAFILFILATAGVKGFAFVLGIGTMLSLFTAVLATQAIILSLRGSRILSTRSALGAGHAKHKITFDFMGASKWFFSMSGLILLIGALAIAGKGINFGIDFESGTRITAPLERSASVESVRNALDSQGLGEAKIQTVDNPELGKNVVQISTDTLAPKDVDQVNNTLDDRFGLSDEPNVESIGPTFGESVANSALIAIIASLAVISIYIALRFEWKYAVPVLIALMHDILITAGVYSLVGREVTTSTVAALLTIVGFSLYDTIIVFDRIRENVPRMPSAAFSQIVNRSMAEVIVRSLATSFCTVLPVLALLFFGGETLKDFAFALIVGTISGAYSSVFIAAPVLTHWKDREPVYRTRERRIRAELGYLPAYAVATGGGPVDVAPAEPRAGRRSVTAPQDPSQVSREEFDAMVRDLGIEEPRQPAGTGAGRSRPAGGRRARANGGRTGGGPAGGSAGGPARPADKPRGAGDGGESGATKPKKPRNRKHKHGRPR